MESQKGFPFLTGGTSPPARTFAGTHLFLVSRTGVGDPNAGLTENLEAITAVVLGGTSLFGGRGGVLGTLVGALIVGVFRNGLQLAGVQVVWQGFAIGLLVLIAVSIDQWIRKVKA